MSNSFRLNLIVITASSFPLAYFSELILSLLTDFLYVFQILELLSETDWGIGITEIRPIRNELCNLLGVKPPISIADTKK